MRIVLQQIWLKRLPHTLLLKLLPYFDMKKNNLNLKFSKVAMSVERNVAILVQYFVEGELRSQRTKCN